MTSKRTAVIMDGNNLAFRAMATLTLTAPSGVGVSAVWGSLNMIRSTLEKLAPDAFFVAWDLNGSHYRKGLYPEYKGHRKGYDEEEQQVRNDFYRQIDVLYETLPLWGIRQVRIDGVEADDIMYSWVKRHRDKFDRIIIVTMDRDLWQLVDDVVMVFNPIKNVYIHKGNFTQMTEGITLEQYIDSKVLQGDSSDNIPGIRGCGEVTTKKFLDKYSSIFNMLNVDEYRAELAGSAVGARILENEATLELNRKLMDLSLAECAGLEEAMDDCLSKMVEYAPRRAKQFCATLGFVKFLEDMTWWEPFERLAEKQA